MNPNLLEAGITIIGLGFRAKQGKTSVGLRLAHEAMAEAQNPEAVRIYNFSDALSATARALGLMQQEKNSTVLQHLGDVYEKIDPHHWINQLEWRILDDKPAIAIVAGIRTRAAFDWIKLNEGATIQVVRLLSNGTPVVVADRDLTHHTEHTLANAEWDYKITLLDGDVEALERDCKSLWTALSRRFYS